jgi:hypothetical protein
MPRVGLNSGIIWNVCVFDLRLHHLAPPLTFGSTGSGSAFQAVEPRSVALPFIYILIHLSLHQQEE